MKQCNECEHYRDIKMMLPVPTRNINSGTKMDYYIAKGCTVNPNHIPVFSNHYCGQFKEK